MQTLAGDDWEHHSDRSAPADTPHTAALEQGACLPPSLPHSSASIHAAPASTAPSCPAHPHVQQPLALPPTHPPTLSQGPSLATQPTCIDVLLQRPHTLLQQQHLVFRLAPALLLSAKKKQEGAKTWDRLRNFLRDIVGGWGGCALQLTGPCRPALLHACMAGWLAGSTVQQPPVCKPLISQQIAKRSVPIAANNYVHSHVNSQPVSRAASSRIAPVGAAQVQRVAHSHRQLALAKAHRHVLGV